MNLFKRTFWVPLQCSLWMVLMVFATLGCSAKQNLFGAFDVVLEKPLTAGKTISNTTTVSCDFGRTSQEVNQNQGEIQKAVNHEPWAFEKPTSLLSSLVLAVMQEHYRLRVAGTSPPLYLLFKKLKLALVA